LQRHRGKEHVVTDVDAVAEILKSAAETHHRVWAITDGAHDDWATWYSDWLITLSRLPEELGRVPVRSELTHALVQLDRDHRAAGSSEPWERWYAKGIIQEFRT
jgi:hypothetical protein